MRITRLVILSLVLVTYLVPKAVQAQLKTVRLAMPAVTVFMMPMKLTDDKGFYREEGLDVDMILMPGSLSVKALVGGSADYTTASGSTIAAAVRGIPIKLLSVISFDPTFDLMAQKDLKSIKDLRGKLIGLSSRGGTLEHLTRLMLEKSGLNPDKDATMIVVGRQASLRNAIRVGRIAAALIAPPGNLQLMKEGFKSLGYTGDYMAYHPTGGIGAADEKIKNDRKEVFAFVKASIRGQKYYMTHRSEGIQAIMKHLGVKDKSLAAKTYDDHIKTLAPDGYGDDKWKKEAMGFVQTVMEIKKAIPPSQVFDFSIAKQAAAELR